MSKVSISLISEGTLVFTLYHSQYCETISACECEVLKQLRPVTAPDGSVGTKYQKVVNPRSVYLNYGETVVLADAVFRIGQVAEAHRRGLLKVEVVPEPALDEVKVSESAAPEPATSEDS